MVFERLPCRVTCLNHARFLPVARRGACGPCSDPSIGIVPQVGDAKKFLQTYGLESLGPVFSQQAGYMCHIDRGVLRWQDLYNLNLLAKLMALLCQNLFNLAIAVIAETILMQIFAEQVSS